MVVSHSNWLFAFMKNPYCAILRDRTHETGEQRWHAGAVPLGPHAKVVLLVVHAYRENIHGEEIIRIISARRAEKSEIARYREQAVD
jgi:uncharacterized DUF497 family protein